MEPASSEEAKKKTVAMREKLFMKNLQISLKHT
jgi:hypothetical protein